MTTPLAESPALVATRRPFPTWLVAFFLTVNAGLLLLVGWAFLRFDSVENALAFAAGRTLSVRDAEQEAGTIVPGSNHTFTFIITNPEATPVRIVGARTGCACTTTAQAMPFTIPGGGRFAFRATLHTPAQPGPFRMPITLFTNHPAQPQLALAVTGHIAAESAPATTKISCRGRSLPPLAANSRRVPSPGVS